MMLMYDLQYGLGATCFCSIAMNILQQCDLNYQFYRGCSKRRRILEFMATFFGFQSALLEYRSYRVDMGYIEGKSKKMLQEWAECHQATALAFEGLPQSFIQVYSILSTLATRGYTPALDYIIVSLFFSVLSVTRMTISSLQNVQKVYVLYLSPTSISLHPLSQTRTHTQTHANTRHKGAKAQVPNLTGRTSCQNTLLKILMFPHIVITILSAALITSIALFSGPWEQILVVFGFFGIGTGYKIVRNEFFWYPHLFTFAHTQRHAEARTHSRKLTRRYAKQPH